MRFHHFAALLQAFEGRAHPRQTFRIFAAQELDQALAHLAAQIEHFEALTLLTIARTSIVFAFVSVTCMEHTFPSQFGFAFHDAFQFLA